MRITYRILYGLLIWSWLIHSVGAQEAQEEKIKLIYERVWEAPEVFAPMIEAYQRNHPNVEIEYKQTPIANYISNLKPSLDAGVGPDMFEIHANWLPYYIGELMPIPENVYSQSEYASTFHDFVTKAFLDKGQLWAIALEANTFSLFYNKDIFKQAGLPDIPPRSWDELIEYAVAIKNKTGKYGIALGTARTTPQDHNVLEMFAVQNGAKPISDDLKKSMVDSPQFVEALEFYTSFVTKYGVWPASTLEGGAAFKSGDLGMLINGSWFINAAVSSGFNVGTANVPQKNPAQPYTHATFWGEVVSKDCKHPEIAWDFIKFCSNRDNVRHFFRETKRPPSRRDLLYMTADDPAVQMLIPPFINQAVYAGMWFKPWEDAWKTAQLDAIDAVILAGMTPENALKVAAEKETGQLENYWRSTEYSAPAKTIERTEVKAGPNEDLYTVLPGDNLRQIAQLFYSDPDKWNKIYDRNLDRIIHPAYIYNGQVLIIPKN